MMLVQCLYADGSDAGKLLAAMRVRCVDVVATMFVRPYPVKVFANLAPFIAKQHYKINYNQIPEFLLPNRRKQSIMVICLKHLVPKGTNS